MKSFYLEPEDWPSSLAPGDALQLGGAEAHHLLNVSRARDGEFVRLFDGQGREGKFTLVGRTKREALLECAATRRLDKPQPEVYLALGWTKGLRRSWLLEKAVEFEAAGLWFWQARHSQGETPAEGKESWRAQFAAGAKQCGNAWLPEARTFPKGVDELVAAAAGFERRFALWENPDAPRLLSHADVLASDERPSRTLFVLGPEGGFTDKEIQTLDAAGFAAVSLGKRVLRWETAALLCLGLAWWAKQDRNEPQI
jgi:16S rRNA (uracil1498-N3)-methyltransferase